METKSRYEVIADLEEKKRQIICSRDGLDQKLKDHKRHLKQMQRDIEDKEEEIKEFEESMEDQRTTFNELLKSTEETLNRFTTMNQK